MKKSLVARGITGIVASLLGVAAVGCGAATDEQGAEVGSTSEALTAVAAGNDLALATDINGNDITNPAGLEWAASCEIRDGAAGSAFKKLLVGGYSTGGVGLVDAYIYDGSNNWRKVASLASGEGRGEAKLIQVPSHPDRCVLAGGLSNKSGGSARTNAFYFQANGGSGSWNAAGTLTGRAQFALVPCGTDKVLAVGGHSASGFGNPISGSSSSFEVWDQTNSAWAKVLDLTVPVSGFAFAAKNTTQFAIAGGVPSGAPTTNRVEAFEANAACTTITAKATSTLKSATDGTSAINGMAGSVAFFKSGTDELYVVAGVQESTGGTFSMPTDRQKFTVTFTAPASIASNGHTASYLNAAVRFPAVAFDDEHSLLYLVGGEDNSSTTLLGATPVDQVHEINVGTLAIDESPDLSALSTVRLGGTASYMRAIGKVVHSTGMTAQANTLTTIVEKITR